MNNLVIHADKGAHTINRNIYGHFAEHLGRGIYEGFWVGEDSPIPNTNGLRRDVVAALKQLNPPVLRWPGGCFADEYHWKDGIGPRADRPAMLNTHWGGVVENNHFGTHEFFELCAQLGAEPYICGNVGSGTVQEMQQWVEYCTFNGQSPMANLRAANGRAEPWKLPYFGVGNENMGCGGSMRPEYYADEYRRYQTYVRNLGGNQVFKIACGPNGANYTWTEVLMQSAVDYMDGLTLHYYAMPPWGDRKGWATRFTKEEYFETLRLALVMDDLLTRHSTIMDRYDPKKRVALIVDEWGTWWDDEPGADAAYYFRQQNTMRDAMVAALTLNLFHHHGERVRMANLAQTINVLQSVVLTNGPQMILTPTYHVFEMFKTHQDATYLPQTLKCADCAAGGRKIPLVSASASLKAGKILLSLVHTDPDRDTVLSVNVRGAKLRSVTGRILSAASIDAHNSFDEPTNVQTKPYTGAKLETETLCVTLPPAAIVTLELSI
ncbi:MAG: alpha-N-arabinofuranosidase [Lacunisphaera sp.]|nr:alpha-N-arabinofuranosidase [Lacunisphaera sp.]